MTGWQGALPKPDSDDAPLIELAEIAAGVFRVRLNRPDKLNALVEPMRQTLVDTFGELARRADARVCVVTGAGRGFCAGGDIKVMRGLIESDDTSEVHRFLDWGAEIVTAMRELPMPVLAAVNGPAAGAGMNLALACDYRIASERASFGETFVNIGLHSDWGGAHFLPQLVGSARALELLWTGRMVPAAEALQMGIVQRVVPHDDLMNEVERFAVELATRPKHVLALTKKSVYAAGQGLAHSLELEKSAQAACLAERCASERMLTFLDARKR